MNFFDTTIRMRSKIDSLSKTKFPPKKKIDRDLARKKRKLADSISTVELQSTINGSYAINGNMDISLYSILKNCPQK
jgi:hypothetical protein